MGACVLYVYTLGSKIVAIESPKTQQVLMFEHFARLVKQEGSSSVLTEARFWAEVNMIRK